ncbi:hypothetical protein DY000_02042680 [Brassica cretica]|uniref:Uncharacterized protein n=1 Tax=Brassica cretica TaxID=69181 RepID=A0ABQ7BK04_BRACR|nr:hypothetical protein DY000_02042680 [Brassica cretica]
MSADNLNNQQTRDGNTAGDNVENTIAPNVTAVNINTVAFEEQEQGQFFRAEQPESVEEDSISQLLQTGDLPPIVEDKEEGEIGHVDVDSSIQFEPTDEDTDVHPRRTRSRAAQDDSQFDNPMT